jgi:hypothetical protein
MKEPEFEGKSLFYKVVVSLWVSGLFFLGALYAYLTKRRSK